MAIFDFLGRNSSSGGVFGALVRLVLRSLQFIFALVVIGMYSMDLRAADKADAYTDSKWVFAVVVGSLSAVTTLVYGIPFLKSYWGFGWDFVLFVLWTATFGVFGNIFIKANPTPEQHGVQRMKNAVWIDLINMLLWFITTRLRIFGTIR